MQIRSLLRRIRTSQPGDERYWYTRFAQSLIFLTLVLAVAGGYVAYTIPVSVFPQTDFPRVVIGIDNRHRDRRCPA